MVGERLVLISLEGKGTLKNSRKISEWLLTSDSTFGLKRSGKVELLEV